MFDLRYKMLKAGYINLHNLTDRDLSVKEETPPKSILSPLFANIFFERLDFWVESNLLVKYNTPRKDEINPAYPKTVYKHLGIMPGM